MLRINPHRLEGYLSVQRGAATRLAAACGVSKAQVSNWTHGREPVPFQYNSVIANFLGVSLDELCAQNALVPLQTLEMQLLNEVMLTLTRDQQFAVLQAAKELQRKRESEP